MNYTTTVDSPIGRLLLKSNGAALTAVQMDAPARDAEHKEDPDAEPLPEAARQLAEYFAGTRRVFHLPLAPQGTRFQQTVWQALTEIPFGVTWSYGQLARRIGNPKASRAVGLANGSNPIAILVPCHRVIGADGSLTGYGGGIGRKQWLLAHEGIEAWLPAQRLK